MDPLARIGRRRAGRWTQLSLPHWRAAQGTATARETFDELSRSVTWPHQPVLRWHLARYLLPGVALYRTLQADGYPPDRAAEALDRVLEADLLRRRSRLARLGGLPGFFPAFAVVARAVSPVLFPSPGWRIRWLEVSRNRVAFDIDRCFYLSTLTALGAPELTAHYCRGDDVLYDEVSPRMAWRRTGTLATGCDRCDFRYDRVRARPAAR